MTFETSQEAFRFAERAFVAVAIWQILASWGMLHLGLRLTIRQPRVKCWSSLALAVGSNIALGAGLVVSVLLAIITNSPSPAGLVAIVLFLGLGIGATLSCVFIKAAFSVSFARAARAWSWMLAATAVSVAAMVFVVQPAVQRGFERDLFVCCGNQGRIGSRLSNYRHWNDNKWPSTLDALVGEGYGLSPLSPVAMHCPLFRRICPSSLRKWDYFYLPPANEDPDRIILCDFRGNHSDGTRWVIQIKQGDYPYPVHMRESEFQAALADPANADFAKALRQAEAVVTTAPTARE